jgi:hypothetical protein
MTNPDKGAEIIIGKLDGSEVTVTYWKESSFSFLLVKKDGESEVTVSNYPVEERELLEHNICELLLVIERVQGEQSQDWIDEMYSVRAKAHRILEKIETVEGKKVHRVIKALTQPNKPYTATDYENERLQALTQPNNK